MQVHSIRGLESDVLRQDFRGCRILQRNLGAPQVQLHFCAVALCNAHGSNTYCCWDRKNKGGVTRFQNKSVSCAVAPLGWTLRPIGLRDVVELECRSLMVTNIKLVHFLEVGPPAPSHSDGKLYPFPAGERWSRFLSMLPLIEFHHSFPELKILKDVLQNRFS